MSRPRSARAALVAAVVLGTAAAVVIVSDRSSRPDGADRDVAPDDVLRRPAPTPALALRAAVETQPVRHDDDAADDIAIWVHPREPGLSTVIGTDKRGGIAVYDLSGRELQYLADGRLNRVDLRRGLSLGRRRVALAAASNLTDDSVRLYRIDARTRRLARAGSFKASIAAYGPVYRREGDNRFVRTLTVAAARGIDGAQHTDGLDVTTRPLGPHFPGGMLVVQDDHNNGHRQNFKLVPWRRPG